jgi:hypothetical protein
MNYIICFVIAVLIAVTLRRMDRRHQAWKREMKLKEESVQFWLDRTNEQFHLASEAFLQDDYRAFRSHAEAFERAATRAKLELAGKFDRKCTTKL